MFHKVIPLKPMSVNIAWCGRRFKSKAYKQYEKDFFKVIGRVPKIGGDIEVTIEWYIKNDKMTDIDNPTKPLLDLLSKAGLWEDDRKIRALHLYKYGVVNKNDERIVVVVEEI